MEDSYYPILLIIILICLGQCVPSTEYRDIMLKLDKIEYKLSK